MSDLELLNKLYVLDTLHDFWKERGGAVKNNGDDDDDEPMDENKLIRLRELLMSFLINFSNNRLYNASLIPTNDLNSLAKKYLSTLTNNKLTSFSDYENSVVTYYESLTPKNASFNLHAGEKESIRYGDIIRAWDNKGTNKIPKLWQDYIDSVGVNYILEIYCGDDEEYPSFGMIEANKKQNIVANFILLYFFPDKALQETDPFYHFTFDAKAGILKKIFRDIENTIQLITPANIADSAPTSLNLLSNRNEYFFPISYHTNDTYNFDNFDTYNFTSNFFTKTSPYNVEFSFIDNDFGSKKNFGFTFNLSYTDKNGEKQNFLFPFSDKQKQGASVNYLVDLVLTSANKNKNPIPSPKQSTVMNLSSLIKNASPEMIAIKKSGLFYDIKRSGDYEQVNSAFTMPSNYNVIFVTIDILAALYNRLKQKNGIWHYKEKLSLYRFPKKLTPDQMKWQQLQRVKSYALKTLEKIKIIVSLYNNTVLADVDNMIIQLNIAIKNGIFKFKSNKKKNKEDTKPDQIATILIRLRLIDIYIRVTEIKNNINPASITESNVNEIKSNIKILETFINSPNFSTQNAIEELIKKYKYIDNMEFYNFIKDKLNFNRNQIKILADGKNNLGLEYSFCQGDCNINKQFKTSGECESLNFSNKFYKDIWDLFDIFDRMVNSKSQRDKKLYDKLTKMTYFTDTTSLYNSYFDKDYAESVYNILQPGIDVVNPTTDTNVEIWYNGLVDKLNEIYNERLYLIFPQDITTPPKTSKLIGGINENFRSQPFKQGIDINNINKLREQERIAINTGMVASPIQFYDLSDLLREISGMSAQFIENYISEEILNKKDINGVKKYNNVPPPSVVLSELINDWKTNEPMMNAIIETYNNVVFRWTYGLMTIQQRNNLEDGYTYVKTPTEFYITYILSFYWNNNTNDYDDYYKYLFTPVFDDYFKEMEALTSDKRRGLRLQPTYNLQSSVSTIVNRNTMINDIAFKYLTSGIPAEILNLFLFTLIDNTMQKPRQTSSNSQKYLSKMDTIAKIGFYNNFLLSISSSLPSTFFDNKTEWDRLPVYIYTYFTFIEKDSSVPPREVLNLLKGGRWKTQKNKSRKNQTRKRSKPNKTNKRTLKNKKRKNKTR